MPYFSVNLEFEVYCANCGKGLCNFSTVIEKEGKLPKVYVEPCPDCLEENRDKGYKEGFDTGYEQGIRYNIEGEDISER